MKLLLCFCSTQFISGSLVLFGGPHNMRNLHPRANSVSARLEISTDERLGAGFFWQPWVIYQNPIGWAYRSIKEVALPLWRVCMSFKGKATFTVSPRKNSTSRCCEDVKLILKKKPGTFDSMVVTNSVAHWSGACGKQYHKKEQTRHETAVSKQDGEQWNGHVGFFQRPSVRISVRS